MPSTSPWIISGSVEFWGLFLALLGDVSALKSSDLRFCARSDNHSCCFQLFGYDFMVRLFRDRLPTSPEVEGYTVYILYIYIYIYIYGLDR